MKTIAVKLPDHLLSEIQNITDKRGETRSQIIREALELYLKKDKSGGIKSCLDLVRDLAGCVQGPPDLSTNKTHMDEYGR